MTEEDTGSKTIELRETFDQVMQLLFDFYSLYPSAAVYICQSNRSIIYSEDKKPPILQSFLSDGNFFAGTISIETYLAQTGFDYSKETYALKSLNNVLALPYHKLLDWVRDDYMWHTNYWGITPTQQVYYPKATAELESVTRFIANYENSTIFTADGLALDAKLSEELIYEPSLLKRVVRVLYQNTELEIESLSGRVMDMGNEGNLAIKNSLIFDQLEHLAKVITILGIKKKFDYKRLVRSVRDYSNGEHVVVYYCLGLIETNSKQPRDENFEIWALAIPT